MFTCMLVNQHKAVRHTDIRGNNTYTSKKGWNLRSKRFVPLRKHSRKTAHPPTHIAYAALYINCITHAQKKKKQFVHRF